MNDWIIPMLAKSSEVADLAPFIDDDNWVFEQKLDGHRLLLKSPGMDMPPTPITRNGTIYSRKLPERLRHFRFPNNESGWVLDGELVGDVYWIFDLPQWPGDTQSRLSLFQRRAVLEALYQNEIVRFGRSFRLVPQAKTRDEKIALAEKTMANNSEGLILKHANSQYISGGRTDSWLKLKYVATADVIVLDVRDDGKDSVRLGLVGEDGVTIQDVGRASLIGKEKNGRIIPGDVVEVKYLYTGAGGRLYQPTILRVRDDKEPPECTVAQLKHVNKEVLEAL